MADENASTSGASATLAAADQNGTATDKLPAPPQTGEEIIARLEAIEASIASHGAAIETTAGLVEKLSENHDGLAVQLAAVADAVEKLAPLSPEDAQLVRDAITLAADLRAALPRIAALEGKIRQFF